MNCIVYDNIWDIIYQLNELGLLTSQQFRSLRDSSDVFGLYRFIKRFGEVVAEPTHHWDTQWPRCGEFQLKEPLF